jgi:hypothetical protein
MKNARPNQQIVFYTPVQEKYTLQIQTFWSMVFALRLPDNLKKMFEVSTLNFNAGCVHPELQRRMCPPWNSAQDVESLNGNYLTSWKVPAVVRVILDPFCIYCCNSWTSRTSVK